MDSAVQAILTPAAVALKPLLNRLVFHGIDTCRGMLDVTSTRVRLSVSGVPTFHAFATTAMERLAPELTSAGFVRVDRTALNETWVNDATVRLEISAAGGDEPDSPRAIATEYAVLLTRTIELKEGCSVRVSAIVPQLALYWQAHVAGRVAVSDSAWIEDLIEVVVRHPSIVDDVRSAPGELREIIAKAARAFATSNSCRWVLRRALPDARHNPAFVDQVRSRFEELAALA